MPRISALEIENYRSIGDAIRIEVPTGLPLVLIGENNAGKSNIVRALNLILGPWWPGNHDPEDHEFYDRDRTRRITISVEFDPEDRFGGQYDQLIWQYADGQDRPIYGGNPPRRRGPDPDFVRSEMRDACTCMVVEADRNLHWHLGYSSKYTLLSKLMHRFHKALVADEETKEELEELFERVKERFERIEAFAEFSRTLRSQLADLSDSMTHRLEVDFQAYNPVNFFRALRLHASEDGVPRSLEELGTGEQQILALSFAYAYATAFHGGLVLVIEEPEAHLHPLAQRWLAERIGALCADGLQVIMTTHSPHFIDLLALDGLVLVKKPAGSTIAVQVDRRELVRRCRETGAETTEETILPFYASQSTAEILEGFFANAVVLVEGDTEALAIPRYLHRCGLNVLRAGIAVVSVGGKGNLAKWRRLFEAFGTPTYVVFDNDGRRDDRDGRKRRDALRAVGIPADEHDDCIGVEDWRVEERVAVFRQNFEEAMRAFFGEYADLEARAAEQGVSGKPFVARWIASRIEVRADDAGWERFRGMARAIARLAGVTLCEEAEDGREIPLDRVALAGKEEAEDVREEAEDGLPF